MTCKGKAKTGCACGTVLRTSHKLGNRNTPSKVCQHLEHWEKDTGNFNKALSS